MRTLLIALLITGCSHAAKHDNPPPPPEQPDPLRADLDVFCGPEAAAKTTSMPELGSYVEPKMHDTDVKTALLALKDGKTTIMEFDAQMKAAMAKAHVDSCPTLDKLMSPKPTE